MKSIKWRRVTDYEVLGGVCAGLAYYLGTPTWVIRMILVIAAIFFDAIGITVTTYVVLWIFMPAWEKTPEDYRQICE